MVAISCCVSDTDQNRYVPGAEDYIIESLKWCGLVPNEGVGFGGELGPYRQSERKPIYKKYADQLIENGFAYYAFDTAEELDELRKKAEVEKQVSYDLHTRNSLKNSLTLSTEEVAARLQGGEHYVIRFKMLESRNIVEEDLIRGRVSFNTNQLDDKVLFKSVRYAHLPPGQCCRRPPHEYYPCYSWRRVVAFDAFTYFTIRIAWVVRNPSMFLALTTDSLNLKEKEN